MNTRNIMEVRYIVKTAFKYAGKQYKAGEEFTPAGGKFDAAIIRNMTRTEPVKEDEVKHGKNTRKQKSRVVV